MKIATLMQLLYSFLKENMVIFGVDMMRALRGKIDRISLLILQMKNIVVKMWPGVVLGVVFLVSGFVKAVDPMGFAYKIEEYLGMFQLAGWKEFSVTFSVLLCVAEMALGLMLLLQVWRRVTAVAVTIFILGFTVLTYLIYTDPYGGINECGCFGEALYLSNGATFAKNIVLLVLAGVHAWYVFRQGKVAFRFRQIGIVAGVLVVAFYVPLYSYFYLPPFDFLPYNVGTRIGVDNAINLYNSDFEDVTEKVFPGDKPIYMVGMKEEASQEVSSKLAALYEAYQNRKINLFAAASESGMRLADYKDIPVYFMDNVALKSILRSPVGVVAFTADRRIVGKWNLIYTPYRFEGGYGEELSGERLKIGIFCGVLLIMVVLLLYGRKRMKA